VHFTRLLMSTCCTVVAYAVTPPQEPERWIPTFGTTVVIAGGLRGEIYNIPPGTRRLPSFEHLQSVGAIYTNVLNVPVRDFREGFPGVTERFEWFAIDYRGRFWIDKPGKYEFALKSDDGAILYIDDRVAIDNDGLHPPRKRSGAVKLSGGIHSIRVSYFQGPAMQVALVLSVKGVKTGWRIFSADDFAPPSDPELWLVK
jgi:PA14 domain-containing protein